MIEKTIIITCDKESLSEQKETEYVFIVRPKDVEKIYDVVWEHIRSIYGIS
jgi:hypothetical protein